MRGELRQDLAYRLSTFEIKVPPLRERVSDIQTLARRFMDQEAQNLEFCDCALEAINGYAWPGNVRELRSVIQRVAATVEEPLICRQHLCLPQARSERKLDDELLEVLECFNWNVTAAAQEFGVGRSTLYRKMKALGISRRFSSSL